MEFIRKFEDIGKNDASIAGGKGASLGEMTSVGIQVPPGYVILSAAFEKFLEETDINIEIDSILHTVNREEMHTVEYASAKIQDLVLKAEMPHDIARDIMSSFTELDAEFVAVRSSATAEDSASAAWAGQLDSFLNTNETELLANVQRCWASLFTPRAIFYRFEKDLHLTKISVAVVVQKMVTSECSGIAFSVHPVTEDRNQLIIEAGFGLGEAIVSGQVTPDSYVVEKEPRRIIDTNISTQTRALYRAHSGGNEWKEISESQASSQVLSEKQIFELSEIIVRIENHYGFPCDIEWALEAGEFYIVQSRPITTLAPEPKKKVIAANKYVGEIDISKNNELVRLFTREYSIFAFYYWSEDVLKHIQKWATLKNMLILSEGNENSYAGVFYVNSEIVTSFSNLQDLINTSDYFERQEEHFKKTLMPVLSAQTELEKNQTLPKLQDFIKIFFAWYMENVSVMHSVVDLEGIDEEKRKRALVYREQTQELDASLSSIVYNTLVKLYPEYKDLLWYIVPDELPLLENGLTKEKKKEILKRKDEGWFFLNGKFFVGKQNLESELKKLDLTIYNGIPVLETNEIQGTTAYGGKVTGKVKIIKSVKELQQFIKGEILVCPMSNPDYLPFIKKAAAMITDEGGLTCHAAIVAREMKKPCVIGTKIATQVLKDGDLVEVDADKGVVKILKRSRQTFTKAYTRNFSIIMQQAWFAANKEGIVKKLGLQKYPYNPPYIYFMKDGVEEVWENTQSNVWLLNQLLKKYESESTFFSHLYKRYFDRLTEIEKWWKEDIKTIEELKKFIEVVYEAVSDFVVLYSVLLDKRTSQEYQELASKFREKDVLFANCNETIMRALNNIYPDYGYLVTYITQEELSDVVHKEELEKRDTGFIMIPGLYQGVTTFNEFIKKFPQFDFVVEKVGLSNNEIKGQTGYKGKIIGSVRIVKRLDQAEKITEGEIIVSPMTTPDFINAMKKAVAFVTDEGGITCHAAIIARELKKPCVIGTKIASQILKDGDLVEVDADKGIVKILERGEDALLLAQRLEKDLSGDEMFQIKAPWAPLLVYLFGDSATGYKKYHDMNGRKGLTYLHAMNNRESIFCFSKNMYDWFAEDAFKKFWNGKVDTAELKNMYGELVEDFDRMYSDIVIDTAVRSEEELILYAKKITKLSSELFLGTIYIEAFDLPILEKVISKDEMIKVRSVFPKLAHVPLESFEMRRNKMILNHLKTNKPLRDLRYIYTDYFSAKSLHEIENMVSEFPTSTQMEDHIRSEESKLLHEVDQYQEFLKGSDDCIQKLGTYFQCIIELRDIRKDSIAKAQASIFTIAEIFLERAGLSKELASYLIPRDLFEGIDSLRQRGEEIKARPDGFVVYIGLDDKFYTSHDLQKELDYINQITIGKRGTNEKEVRGQTAHRGIVQGIAKIILDPENATSFNQGDILITSMTRPEFVPLMKKARAIVTNEGGITCHAAIISRELDIPCVIGTKYATDVLKDGDLVEVDADAGVVRVLRRSETPHAQDFELTFESQGTSFLFEDLVAEYYMPGESVTLHSDTIKRTYIHKTRINELGDAGVNMSEEELQGHIAQLEAYIKEAEKLAHSLRQLPEFNQKEAKLIVDLIARIFSEYFLFEFSYWDKTFALSEINISAKHKVALIASYKNKFRTDLEPIFFGDGCLPLLIKKTADTFGELNTNLVWYRIHELVDLFDKKRVSQEEIERRKKGFLHHVRTDGTIHFSSGDEALVFIDRFLGNQVITMADVIHGKRAHSIGKKIKGRVRIVYRDYGNEETFSKVMSSMEHGEVLVAQTTDPELMPALLKASAIITDTGGLLSHSAIVARELNIPCIIDTKNASKILKTGDLVEVDADAGVVRVLEQIKESGVPEYEKIFSRDFCLPLVEAWCRAESTDPRVWTEKQQPKIPYIIFERKGGVVNCYMDNSGIEWIKNELSQLVSKDPNYVQFAADSFVESTKSMSEIWKKEGISDLQELRVYLKNLRSAWVWFEAVWWLMELFQNDKEQIKKLMPARLATEKIGDGSDALIREALRKIFPHLGEAVDCLLIEEIESGNIPSQLELEKRKNGYIYTSARLIVGGRIKDVESEFGIKVNEISVDSLRQKLHVSGKSAYNGLVQGRVKIILLKNQISSLKDGEILVTAMTTPDFLPALQKAVAFVTDEGGITCHAAIVARELKKPCVIGTKIATQVLHDGDLVEVDADNGVVRVLEQRGEITQIDFFKPDNFEFNFNGRGVRIYFEDYLDLPYYMPRHCIAFSKDDDMWSFFSKECFAEMAKEAHSEEFLNMILKKSLEVIDGEKKVQMELEKLSADTSNLSITALTRIKEILAPLVETFSLYNNGYLDSLFQYGATLDKVGKQKIVMVGQYKNDLREILNHLIIEPTSPLNTWLRSVEVHFGLERSTLDWYREAEVITLLHSGIQIPDASVRARRNGYVFLKNEDVITFYEGDEAINFINEYLPKEETTTGTFVSGVVAHKTGKIIQGKVRKIITDYSDMERMHREADEMIQGEILVSQITAPEIMIACKKASAIVTDIGGLLSHAAIVSRELDIPCIVGTKQATKLFKTGDLIEVDADNGVVRILERSKKSLYTKVFSRDFCVPALEGWYRGESLNDKMWTNKRQERFPYIVFERKDGTVHCYYDLEGVQWIKNLLWETATNDKGFIPMLLTVIPEKLKFIRPIYEELQILSHDNLVKFISEIEAYYPWFEAMWWLMEMSDKELQGLDVSTLRELRKETDKLSSGTNIVIRTSLEKLYPEIKEYVHVLRGSEIKSENFPPIEELQKRDQGFFFTADKIYIDTTREQIENEFNIVLENNDVSSDTPITGSVAYKGKETGVVCRVMGHKDIHKIKEGEILVSPMTMPDMLPAMQKARAFVTDEGGITCHAAIVAREMKKPCVIGTKIATQVLKDGDLVEVDADNGVVRILGGVEEVVQETQTIIEIFRKFISTEEVLKLEGNLSLLLSTGSAGITFCKKLNQYYGFNIGDIFFISKEKHGLIIMSKNKYRELADAMYRKFIIAREECEEVKDFKRLQTEVDKVYVDHVSCDWKLLDNPVISSRIQDYFDLYESIFASTFFSIALDETMIKEYYEKISANSNLVNEFVKNSSIPIFESFSVRKNKALVNFDGDVDPLVYVFADYCIAPNTDTIRNEIHKIIDGTGSLEIKKELDVVNEKNITNNNILNTWKKTLSDDQRTLYDFVQLCIRLRDIRKEYLQKMIVLISSAAKELAFRTTGNREDAIYMLPYDFRTKLYLQSDYTNNLERRKKEGLVIHFSNNITTFEYGDVEIKREKMIALIDNNIESNMISGSVAYGGKVLGVARVVMSDNDFASFKNDEVLITSMTRAEYVPLMKIARAVVTDEGGVTCHAAIISREFKKPCVIGTGNATRRIKNGDLVEVDADQGVVRIIK